jgi:hypothetical protein
MRSVIFVEANWQYRVLNGLRRKRSIAKQGNLILAYVVRTYRIL